MPLSLCHLLEFLNFDVPAASHIMMIGSKVVCPIVVAAAVLEATLVQGVGAFGFSARGRGESITSALAFSLPTLPDSIDN